MFPFRRFNRIAATVLLFTATLFSQNVVCRKKFIDGMESNAARAHKFLSPDTSDMSKVAIYVEKVGETLYFHSNYVTPGADNPTKVAVKHGVSFDQIFVNVAYGDKFTFYEQEAALTAFRRYAQIYLDESMFSERGDPLIDVHLADNVSVVSGTNGKVLVGQVERLDTSSPPSMLMSRVVGCCLYGIPPHLVGDYQQQLAASPIDKTNVRLLSLVRDTATEFAIRNSNNIQRLGDPNVPVTKLDQIEQAFQAAKGTTVVLLSHVEENNFVTRSPTGEIVSSMPMQAVRDLASKYNVQLIDLGCETSHRLRAEKMGIGVMTKFNTFDAVRALDRALEQAANYSEFFQALTSQNLKIVIDHGFMMQGWPLCTDIYSKAQGRLLWVKVARVFVNLSHNKVNRRHNK